MKFNDMMTGVYSLNADQLRQLNNRVVDLLKSRSREATRKFIVGHKVKFRNSRTGGIVHGTVVKVNRLRVIVNSGYTRWTVPANMLEMDSVQC